MFALNGWTGGGGSGGGEVPLDADEAVVLWGMRRLAPLMTVRGPMARCAVVDMALIRQFGERGGEIGAALRCLLQGLRLGAERPVHLGCVGAMTADERQLLDALRRPGDATALLDGLIEPARTPVVAQLIGLLASLVRGS